MVKVTSGELLEELFFFVMDNLTSGEADFDPKDDFLVETILLFCSLRLNLSAFCDILLVCNLT